MCGSRAIENGKMPKFKEGHAANKADIGTPLRQAMPPRRPFRSSMRGLRRRAKRALEPSQLPFWQLAVHSKARLKKHHNGVNWIDD